MARYGESKASAAQRNARMGIQSSAGGNYNNGVRMTSKQMSDYTKKNALKNRGGGSGSSGLSAEAKAMQAKQDAWLDKSGGLADKQSGVGSKMEARADRIGNRDIAAGEASSEVASAYDAAKGQQNRDMSRYGVNPNSGRFAHGQRVMANARAAADAGARTKARRNADRDSMAAYGQTQNAYSQAANTNFGVYDRYDKLTDEFSANQNYQEPSGSNFGGFTMGGGGRNRSTKRVDHNALSRNREHVTFNKKPMAINRQGGFNLGPNNMNTPLKPDNNNSLYWDGRGGTEQGPSNFNGSNNFSSPYGGQMNGPSNFGGGTFNQMDDGDSFNQMPFDYGSNSELDWGLF